MDYSSVSANELVRICSASDSREAWDEFVRRFQRPIALAVMRTARRWGATSPALLDDLVQEVFLRFCGNGCRLLKEFAPREEDSCIGFLKVVAANVAHDKLRADTSLKRGGATERHDGHFGELDRVFATSTTTESIHRSLRLREIDAVLRSCIPQHVTERDHTIFWLYFEQGFSAREIATIPAFELSTKGVEASLHRSTQHVKEVFQQRVHRMPEKGMSAPFAIAKENP